MDRYHRVEKPRPESAITENEVRITAQGPIRNYLNYATSLLQEKGAKEIVFKAMGQAISKTVSIVEILKKNIPGLHQGTSISSVSITDVWEPIEEGLVPLETTRHVSMISIFLSYNELDKNSPGYQAPLHIEHPRHQRRYQQQQPRENQDNTYVRGRGGRGRGGRGYGNRGGGNGNRYDNNQGAGNRYDSNQDGYGNRYDSNQGGYGNLYDNNRGGYGYNQGGYGYNEGRYGGGGGYNNQENGGWNPNRNRGGGRGGRGTWSYGGYEGGRGEMVPGGRGGYSRDRGRMGGPRGRGNQY